MANELDDLKAGAEAIKQALADQSAKIADLQGKVATLQALPLSPDAAAQVESIAVGLKASADAAEAALNPPPAAPAATPAASDAPAPAAAPAA